MRLTDRCWISHPLSSLAHLRPQQDVNTQQSADINTQYSQMCPLFQAAAQANPHTHISKIKQDQIDQ